MDTLTKSLAVATTSQAMLASSHHRIAASRRALNRFFGVSGAADSPLNQIARALLSAGALAPIRSNVAWAGHGSGDTCCVCGKRVESSEVAYEVDDGERRVGCHFPCFIAWQEESRRNRALG